MKLHLGCGDRYFEGYVNIDLPPKDRENESTCVPDQQCDITKLIFPFGSIDEIRLHHLFEHFTRAQALGLLCRWTDWLDAGGKLRVETPDWDASILTFLSPFTNDDQKEQILRHLFGSHEARWAVHWDAWSKRKFTKVLGALGYVDLVFTKNSWGVTKNIEVIATRGENKFTIEEYAQVVKNILMSSLIKPPKTNKNNSAPEINPSEIKILDIWMSEWRRVYTLSE